jgi:hypothetical protein
MPVLITGAIVGVVGGIAAMGSLIAFPFAAVSAADMASRGTHGTSPMVTTAIVGGTGLIIMGVGLLLELTNAPGLKKEHLRDAMSGVIRF